MLQILFFCFLLTICYLMLIFYYYFFNVKGIESIIGSVALDMGVVTTPQLHWMVRSRNMGTKASESDYFMQLSESFRSV